MKDLFGPCMPKKKKKKLKVEKREEKRSLIECFGITLVFL